MPLDPAISQMMKYMGQRPALNEHTLRHIRGLSEAGSRLLGQHAKPEPVGRVVDITIPAADGYKIPARCYYPEADMDVYPVLIYYHGGGFVLGSVQSHDHIARLFCKLARCAVVSVDYRLAPEHPFPAAVDDAYTSLLLVHRQASEHQWDPERIAIGGDSAGGNLAAVASILAASQQGPAIRYQLLYYPVTDMGGDYPSKQSAEHSPLLSTDDMAFFSRCYIGEQADPDDPRLSPIRYGHLEQLPPALVITAEYDPLRDEGEAFAERLKEAGVPTEAARYDGMIHGFITFPQLLPQGMQAIEQGANALVQAFRMDE
ncbi:alpha/beta hydrolase [Paenibacillus sp. JX-17]|uniref:Alpha/beta hydrolase n=1 Tax=Paenibacillus lacisoli TaxID=3064525 RepID=A0ABT9CC33_9BACL|nr:alpha/beta hydrolase [Paenibacillus sp. JX-17]MDO7906825.1 alpha/beta hydrolase [Paenibacillus sp. JX-17]